MEGQYDDQCEQCRHHDRCHLLETLLKTEGADQEADQYGHGHAQHHLFRSVHQLRKDLISGFRADAIEDAQDELEEVGQHPAGYRRVVHHQKIGTSGRKPAMNMPLTSLRFQCLIGAHGTLMRCPSDGELHREHRDPHDDQKNQIEQYEDTAAVLSDEIRKLPYVSDADGTSGTDQDEADAGLKAFPFTHSVFPHKKSVSVIPYLKHRR